MWYTWEIETDVYHMNAGKQHIEAQTPPRKQQGVLCEMKDIWLQVHSLVFKSVGTSWTGSRPCVSPVIGQQSTKTPVPNIWELAAQLSYYIEDLFWNLSMFAISCKYVWANG